MNTQGSLVLFASTNTQWIKTEMYPSNFSLFIQNNINVPLPFHLYPVPLRWRHWPAKTALFNGFLAIFFLFVLQCLILSIKIAHCTIKRLVSPLTKILKYWITHRPTVFSEENAMPVFLAIVFFSTSNSRHSKRGHGLNYLKHGHKARRQEKTSVWKCCTKLNLSGIWARNRFLPVRRALCSAPTFIVICHDNAFRNMALARMTVIFAGREAMGQGSPLAVHGENT